MTEKRSASDIGARVRARIRLARSLGRSYLQRGGIRTGVESFASNSAALVANLVTGVVLARALGASGRGVVAAILVIPPMLSLIFALGSQQTVAYFRSREPERRSSLLSTWLLTLLPLSFAAVALGEAGLPLVLAAQPPETVAIARIFVLTVMVLLASELFVGFLLGGHHFRLYNALRVGGPSLIAAGYLTLWNLRALTVTSALWTYGLAQLLTLLIAVAFVIRHEGLGRPSLSLARRTAWYGLRGHGTTAGFLLNARLDLLIMPAFLAASSIGLYSVATNVSWITFTLSSSLALVVIPLATRAGEQGTTAIIGSAWATLAVGAVLTGVLEIVAEIAVGGIYGSAFLAGVPALRVLLPGSALYAVAYVLMSGLYTINRPFSATLAQAAGLGVTVIGLLLFLREGGIIAAAGVSTAAYSVVFTLALIAYKRGAHLRWTDFVPSRSNKSDTQTREVIASATRRP